MNPTNSTNSPNSVKTAVVTGGAGFIGSHLAEELSQRNYRVIIFDDLSTGKKSNIAQLLSRDNVTFIEGSITNLELLRATFTDADYVFHHAAIASVPQSVEDPIASNQTNLTGTLNVLLAARESGVKKVVYASTCAVYGDNPASPKREDMIPNPLSPYAVTKLAGEYYCQVFQEVYQLPTVSLRYFNVFGPRQDPASDYAAVIPKFISRVLKSKEPLIFGDGRQTRDFVFVKDVVEANVMAAQSDASGVLNIGSGESITINDLAWLIVKLCQSKTEPIHCEPRAGDIRYSVANISRAKSLGYAPKYTLAEGLQACIAGMSHVG